jgi:hypothetical protein
MFSVVVHGADTIGKRSQALKVWGNFGAARMDERRTLVSVDWNSIMQRDDTINYN